MGGFIYREVGPGEDLWNVAHAQDKTGLAFRTIGQAKAKVLYTTCAGCARYICVPLDYVARCDGVLICPCCGEHEPLSRERCLDIAAILQGRSDDRFGWLYSTGQPAD